jgi:hypothetical protein
MKPKDPIWNFYQIDEDSTTNSLPDAKTDQIK